MEALAVIITRKPSTEQGTFGILTLETPPVIHHWHSLELPWRDNAVGKSCIMPGLYNASLGWSNHFQRMLYHLEDKNGRRAVEIHPANFAGDVALGWASDLLGCITLGKSLGTLSTKTGAKQSVVLGSGLAVQEFMSAANGAPLRITITQGA